MESPRMKAYLLLLYIWFPNGETVTETFIMPNEPTCKAVAHNFKEYPFPYKVEAVCITQRIPQVDSDKVANVG
jgi:hypothetical protein